MDTHAVAAVLMRPLSGNSLEVAHNFNNYAGKGMPSARGSAVTGVQGTYPLYAEAYRRASAERNILPRQLQSITWEAVRGVFPDTFKTQKNVDAVNNILRQYQNGVISAVMQGPKSSTSRAASVHQIGTGDDLVLNYMAKHGIPMTHQNWLEISYPDGVPEWSAELESEVPKIFQLKD